MNNFRYNSNTEKINNVIYMFYCSCKNSSAYIGETGRTIDRRMYEHKYQVAKGTNNTGVGDHLYHHKCNIPERKVKILERENNWLIRRCIEHLYIRQAKVTLMNNSQGYVCSSIW